MGGGASASIQVPADYVQLDTARREHYRSKFDEMTVKALPLELDDAQKSAVEKLTKEILVDQISDGKPVKMNLKRLDVLLHVLESTTKRTALIVDNSEDDKVNTFYSYRDAIMVDGKKMGLDKSLRKRPVADIVEETRVQLVSALKFGKPFVICMTNSVTDFATTFCDEASGPNHAVPVDENKAFLPLEMFKEGGRGLLQDAYMNKIFRDQDKDHGIAVSRNPAGFQVIVTTKFAPEDFEEYLFSNEWGLPKPKEQFQFIIIDNDPKPDVLLSELAPPPPQAVVVAEQQPTEEAAAATAATAPVPAVEGVAKKAAPKKQDAHHNGAKKKDVQGAKKKEAANAPATAAPATAAAVAVLAAK